MSVEFTFLGQLLLKLAVGVGKLPMLAHQVMKHVGAFIVHALQKRKGFERLSEKFSRPLQLKAIHKELMLCETRHRCCAPTPALGD
jgi:hypothetical protein